MKVGIDTFGCDHGRSGLGSYLCSLAANLKNDEKTEFSLFGAELDRYTYTGDNGLNYDGVSLIDTVTAERLWHLLFANRFASQKKYDVVLYPAAAHMMPLTFTVP